MNTGLGLKQTIDLKSRDASGNVIEHIRIHPGGREEIIERADNGDNN